MCYILGMSACVVCVKEKVGSREGHPSWKIKIKLHFYTHLASFQERQEFPAFVPLCNSHIHQPTPAHEVEK